MTLGCPAPIDRRSGALRIAVIGAGPAGLWAAWRAAEAGHQVTVVERAPHVGGMAASIEVAGLRVDLGSHRLHPSTPPAVLARLQGLLGDDLQRRPRRGRVRLADRWLTFPLQAGDLLRHTPHRFAFRAGLDALTGPLRRERDDTFAEVVRTGLGPTVAEGFYAPYVAKIWGVEASELSGELARRRVSASGPLDIARRLVRGRRGGAGTFWYPRRGFGQISEAVAEAGLRAGVALRLSTEVTALDLREGGVPDRSSKETAVCGGRIGTESTPPARLTLDSSPGRTTESADRERRIGTESAPTAQVGAVGSGLDVAAAETLDADLVWSTAPIMELARRATPGPDPGTLQAADRLEHRGLVLVYLVLDGAPWTPFDAHYLPGTELLASRLSEPRNYRDAPDDPVGTTVLCAEIPATVGDATWSATDADLASRLVEDLRRLGLPAVRPVEVRTVRLPRVYPLYRPGFEAHLAGLERWLDQHPQVVSFGRQGLFVPDNTHHALAMAEAAVAAISPDGRFDHAAWSASRDGFRGHVVED